jgi:hypothetical protein
LVFDPAVGALRSLGVSVVTRCPAARTAHETGAATCQAVALSSCYGVACGRPTRDRPGCSRTTTRGRRARTLPRRGLGRSENASLPRPTSSRPGIGCSLATDDRAARNPGPTLRRSAADGRGLSPNNSVGPTGPGHGTVVCFRSSRAADPRRTTSDRSAHLGRLRSRSHASGSGLPCRGGTSHLVHGPLPRGPPRTRIGQTGRARAPLSRRRITKTTCSAQVPT